MKQPYLAKRSTLVFMISILGISLFAQEQGVNSEFKPHVGQEGKDVIWVPTPDQLVNKMLEIAEVTARDFVIDLGSGDGRTVIAAAKLGANAIGIEYNPDMVALSIKRADTAGVRDRTKFINTDLFEYDLSEATVITMFLLPEINLRLRPKLLDLKPGTRIVSNTFTMGDWEPDMEVTTDENWNSWYTALLWIVPAKVEGSWNLGGSDLTLSQNYQMFYGTLKSGSSNSKISDGRLKGNTISFSLDGSKYTGIVNGRAMEGTVVTGSSTKEWKATFKGFSD